MSNSNKPVFSNYPLQNKNSKCYILLFSTICISYPFISIIFISLFAIIGFYIINQRSRNHQALPGNDLQNQYEANQSLEIDLEDVENPYQPTTETLLKK